MTRVVVFYICYFAAVVNFIVGAGVADNAVTKLNLEEKARGGEL